jgi:hypothetical protein
MKLQETVSLLPTMTAVKLKIQLIHVPSFKLAAGQTIHLYCHKPRSVCHCWSILLEGPRLPAVRETSVHQRAGQIPESKAEPRPCSHCLSDTRKKNSQRFERCENCRSTLDVSKLHSRFIEDSFSQI